MPTRINSNEAYVIDSLTNRYDSVGGSSLSYNAAGDLVKDKDSYEYEYDYENRIVKIIKDGNDIAEFAYDALGRRIEKKDLIDSNNTRRYYYNYNWQVLEEYDSQNNRKNYYVYGNYIDEVLRMGGNFYYLHDHLYSPVVLYMGASNNYAVFERYEYDAYGNCHILEPNFADDPDGQSDFDNPYLFTGRRVDILDNGSLKIQYNRNRYYDQHTGRWLTHDPLGITPNPQLPNYFDAISQYKDGLSLYEYVRSNPINKLDQLGLWGYTPMPWDAPLFDCQLRDLAGGWSPYDPFECKWMERCRRETPYPTDCDDDVSDGYCESVLSGTTKFVCKDTEITTYFDVRTRCYTKTRIKVKVKTYMVTYVCTHLNTWSKTSESFSHLQTVTEIVIECVKRRVYCPPHLIWRRERCEL